MAMITGTWAQRCAADADARDWAMEYGRGEFYYSQKWGELTAIADATTTLTDVADAIAAGTASAYHEALAAHYFAQAADYLAGVAQGRVVEAERGHPVPALEDDNGQIPWLRDDSELAVAEGAREFAEAARRQAHEVAREAVDREDDARRWADAEDEDAYHAAGAAAALAADVNEAWRTAVDVEYDQRCADYGNDGRPEDDRHISTKDMAAQAAAVAAIAERTGLPTGAVWDAVRDVTDRYARDHTDTATLGQPDWDQVADSWADMLAEQQAYRDGGARAAAAAALEAAAADREITGTYRDMGWTAEQTAHAQDNMTVTQAHDALDRLAAHAAVSAPAADPGTDTHHLVQAPAGASPTPTAEVDTWAANNPAGEWAANEDVVTRFESDAALTAEAGDGAAALDAHQQRLAQAAVPRDDVTLAHPPAVTDAPLHQHNAILNQGQLAERLAELTATAADQGDDGYTQEPEEQLAGQLIADAQDRGDPPPPQGWSRWAHTQVEQATEDLRDNAADTADARAADPVLWGLSPPLCWTTSTRPGPGWRPGTSRRSGSTSRPSTSHTSKTRSTSLRVVTRSPPPRRGGGEPMTRAPLTARSVPIRCSPHTSQSCSVTSTPPPWTPTPVTTRPTGTRSRRPRSSYPTTSTPQPTRHPHSTTTARRCCGGKRHSSTRTSMGQPHRHWRPTSRYPTS